MSEQKKKMSLQDLGGLVYSTGSMPSSEPLEEETMPASEQSLRVWLEKNHRGGKVATVVKGFAGSEASLLELAKTLKTKCGTGGSAKDGEIIIQGDHRDKVVSLLKEMGYPSKKAGA